MLRTAVAYAHGDGNLLSIAYVLAIAEMGLRKYVEAKEESLPEDEQPERRRVVHAIEDLNRFCGETAVTEAK